MKSGQRSSSRPKTIIGKKVNEGLVSFKGADLTVNKYVGRVHIDVTTEGFHEYIIENGVDPVELEPLETKHRRFKSFRLRVKRSDLPKIEDENFWPAGILISPFFRAKQVDGSAVAANQLS